MPEWTKWENNVEKIEVLYAIKNQLKIFTLSVALLAFQTKLLWQYFKSNEKQ